MTPDLVNPLHVEASLKAAEKKEKKKQKKQKNGNSKNKRGNIQAARKASNSAFRRTDSAESDTSDLTASGGGMGDEDEYGGSQDFEDDNDVSPPPSGREEEEEGTDSITHTLTEHSHTHHSLHAPHKLHSPKAAVEASSPSEKGGEGEGEEDYGEEGFDNYGEDDDFEEDDEEVTTTTTVTKRGGSEEEVVQTETTTHTHHTHLSKTHHNKNSPHKIANKSPSPEKTRVADEVDVEVSNGDVDEEEDSGRLSPPQSPPNRSPGKGGASRSTSASATHDHEKTMKAVHSHHSPSNPPNPNQAPSNPTNPLELQAEESQGSYGIYEDENEWSQEEGSSVKSGDRQEVDKLITASPSHKDVHEGKKEKDVNVRYVNKTFYRKGERVEGNYRERGKWYSGAVGQVFADGTYEIDYDDGEQERKGKEHIRAVEDASSPSKSATGNSSSQVNDIMKAASPVREYEVCCMLGGYLSVILLSCPITTGASGSPSLLPSCSLITIVLLHITIILTLSYLSTSLQLYVSKIQVPNSPSRKSKYTSKQFYRKGERVEGNYRERGKWYSGTVGQVFADGTYEIDYDDGEQERKGKEHIRVIEVVEQTESSAAPPVPIAVPAPAAASHGSGYGYSNANSDNNTSNAGYQPSAKSGSGMSYGSDNSTSNSTSNNTGYQPSAKSSGSGMSYGAGDAESASPPFVSKYGNGNNNAMKDNEKGKEIEKESNPFSLGGSSDSEMDYTHNHKPSSNSNSNANAAQNEKSSNWDYPDPLSAKASNTSNKNNTKNWDYPDPLSTKTNATNNTENSPYDNYGVSASGKTGASSGGRNDSSNSNGWQDSPSPKANSDNSNSNNGGGGRSWGSAQPSRNNAGGGSSDWGSKKANTNTNDENSVNNSSLSNNGNRGNSGDISSPKTATPQFQSGFSKVISPDGGSKWGGEAKAAPKAAVHHAHARDEEVEIETGDDGYDDDFHEDYDDDFTLEL